MQKRKQNVIKQRKTVWASRRNILMRKVRHKILRRNHAYFLTMTEHNCAQAPTEQP
ncbi:hypothetical protein [Oceanisphaera avium]|uniref:hypothetical protein n=1 Tax=Oceanisphaera avium TaxID=1903694 RepID=UPI0012F73BD7|nr:hypothetical protein [Oceanisphaera avium]